MFKQRQTLILRTILAGLLMPALEMARRKALQISCMNNEMNVGKYLILWRDDHSGRMPQAWGQGRDEGEGFLVGGNRVYDSSLTIARLYGNDIAPNITHKFRQGDVRHCYADMTKIKQAIGWEPKISFDEGMKELIEWGREAQADDHCDQAYSELKQKGIV